MNKFAVFAIILILFAASCGSLPRIIVLHDPLSLDEHLTLGLSYEQKGEYDLAVQEYGRAVKMSGKDFRPLFYTGNVYFKKKDYKLAEKYYNKALRLSPDNGDLHNNLAWVYIDTGRYDEAAQEAEKAVIIRRSPYYLNTQAHVYYRLGRYREAEDVLEEAMTLTPAEDKILREDENRLLKEIQMKHQ